MLPELEPGIREENASADVSIQRQSLAIDDFAAAEQGLLRASPEEALFFYPSVGALLVRCGQQILVDPLPGVAESAFSPLILGAAMSVLLSQRGLTALHASCVLMKGEAVAFIGHKGAGKSVMAANLARKGYPLLADDVTAVCQREAAVTVIPASLQTRLLPDALSALGVDAAHLPKVHAMSPKRIWRAVGTDLQPMLPLRCIYVLSQSDDIEIDPLAPVERFVELLRHAYLSRWSSLAHQAPTHFKQISTLANNVPVFRLRRPRQFSLLPQLIETLENIADQS